MINIKKTGYYIGVTACSLLLSTSFVGCSIEAPKKTTVNYGPEIGFADGNVDLSGESPVIDISDIKSPVGENIDYLSGVNIANEDKFETLEISADASDVDIFTPGNYKVTYTFYYDGKSASKEITVTVYETQAEQSASDVPNPDNSTTNKSGEDATTANGGTNVNAETTKASADNNETPGSGNTNTAPIASSTNNSGGTSKPGTTTKPATTNKPVATTKPIVTTKPAATTKPATKPGTTSKATTRPIVTTTGNLATPSKNIGNYTIELLSGKTITIRNTTSKYIVSTKTVVSTTTRGGNTYKVSSLVITFNTGATQVLETVEEKMK